MIRLGMLDFDTSHVIEFARRLNHQDIAASQWVEGAKIVVACAGASKMMPERIPGYTQEIQKLGIPLVARPEDMLGKVDGMLITSQQGSAHWRRARPFLEAGVPCFVDKPFTCNVADAHRLFDLANRKNIPLFTSSALRFAPELVRIHRAARAVQGAVAYGPAPRHTGNPGLFHYGIHAVEVLYTLMGPGCERVTCCHAADADVVTGQWQGGRLGTVHGLRNGKVAYGCVVFTPKPVCHLAIRTTHVYRELLKQIVDMFRTGKSPLAQEVSIEIVGFLEAALRSEIASGLPEPVRS